jgi:hypothetical protein
MFAGTTQAATRLWTSMQPAAAFIAANIALYLHKYECSKAQYSIPGQKLQSLSHVIKERRCRTSNEALLHIKAATYLNIDSSSAKTPAKSTCPPTQP